MRAFGVVVLLLGVVLPPVARAEIGTLDEVPAATLLLPYFEVDLASMSGRSTRLSIGNAASEPAIAHVTLWTDLGYPTLTFDLYLTGFDTVSLDLRQLFTAGTIPGTSHGNTGISNVGSFSLVTHPDTGVGPGTTSCNALLPPPPLPTAVLVHIRAAHTGQASALVLGGACSGVDHGDQVARGYLTIDNTRSCSLSSPNDAGYFLDGGAGIATNLNTLVGDFAYVDETNGRADGFAMVHLEASSGDPLTQPGDYTFYARYSGGADNREALPTTFAARYMAQGAGGESSSYIYWRDSQRGPSPFTCALVAPSPFPLSTNQLVVFDAAENPELPDVSPSSPPPFPISTLVPFAWAAGRVSVDGADFPVSASEGWMWLNLNSSVTGSQVPHGPAVQGWIGVSTTATAGALAFDFSHDAVALDNAGSFAELLLPVCDGSPDPTGCPPLFADGFESGDTSAWSMVVP